ncbi:MAG: lipopolysaccharide biosynthesis protein [Bacteroidota bacterium]
MIDKMNSNFKSEEPSLRVVINNILSWISYIKKFTALILGIALFGALVGVIYAYLNKPIYTAKLSFALEDEKGGNGLGAYAAIAGQFGLDLGGSGGGVFEGDNLLELMKSRTMVEKTLLTPIKINEKQVTLGQHYIDFNNFKEDWNNKIQFPVGLNRTTFTQEQDSLLGEFHKELIKKCLYVDKINKKLSIITVSVSTKNEKFSKYFAELLVKNVADFYIETKIRKSTLNLAILQRQTDSVKRELNQALAGVASSIDVNPNPNPARQMLRVPSQKRQVDVQANTAILTELVKNLEISKVSLRKETPLIQIIDLPIFPLEKTKMSFIKTGVVFSILFILIGLLYLSFIRYKNYILKK